MIRAGNITILFFLIVALGSCTRHVIRQPVQEKDRPLFLPAKNWQISLGIEKAYMIKGPRYENPVTKNFKVNDRNSWLEQVGFIWPSIHFGNYVEYVIPATFRTYICKNTVVIDSIEKISGLNIALVNGIMGGYYRPKDKELAFSTTHSVLIKKPFSNKWWIESFSDLGLTIPLTTIFKSNFTANINIPITLGYQCTNRFSVTGTVLYTAVYNHFALDPNFNEFCKAWEYSQKVYDADIKIPVRFNYVFNNFFELSLVMGGTVYTTHETGLFSGVKGTLTW